ncbi:MAG: hypothetical protein MUC65_08710 [Pontiellaceae bacterium]|jgi:ABC-type phosphate transport system substrate-binding protein|nr:hypothetical protein [Pontiellaceae bacterium]
MKRCKKRWSRQLSLFGLGGFFFLSIAAGATTAEKEGFAVIAGSQRDTGGWTVRELRDVFLGNRKSWPNGDKITLAVLHQGSVHTAFLTSITAKSEQQYTRYWRQLVFSGKGTMPKIFDTEEALLEFVKKEPGAIGCIGLALADSTPGLTIIYKEEVK